MGSRAPKSESKTEVIQKTQRPIVTGTSFSRDYQLGQAALANQLQADLNQASKDYFSNAGEGYTPMSFGTFDYTSLIPSEEELVKQYDQRMLQEKQEKDKVAKKYKEPRKTYLDAIEGEKLFRIRGVAPKNYGMQYVKGSPSA